MLNFGELDTDFHSLQVIVKAWKGLHLLKLVIHLLTLILFIVTSAPFNIYRHQRQCPRWMRYVSVAVSAHGDVASGTAALFHSRRFISPYQLSIISKFPEEPTSVIGLGTISGCLRFEGVRQRRQHFIISIVIICYQLIELDNLTDSVGYWLI